MSYSVINLPFGFTGKETVRELAMKINDNLRETEFYLNQLQKYENATGIPINDLVDTNNASWSATATNFDARNDRISTTPADPVIASDGSAVDHVINTDGSADVSIEWTHTGTGDAYDIDGFILWLRVSTSSAAYTFGTTPAEETDYAYVSANKRAIILPALAADKYYTIGIQAYRMVDQDINADGILTSAIVQPSAAGENPYRPSANVAFAGDVSGTINSIAVATVTTAVSNFNTRNDRDNTAITNPTIATDGTAVDHVINTDGSATVSLEWSWTGDEEDIDGWTIYVYQSDSSSSYTMGTTESAEQVYNYTPEKRAFILPSVPANRYYTFGIQAFRKVDQDISSTGFIKSSIIQPSLAAENPYRPSSSVAFAGNVTGTLDGTSVSTVVNSASNSV
ncbi:MAG: hypothetical protein PHH57_08725, partial [Candidatus Omnitrophica bacterium]|nr:hypothetical protein [Candidatus Omnitrophota bacterium]